MVQGAQPFVSFWQTTRLPATPTTFSYFCNSAYRSTLSNGETLRFAPTLVILEQFYAGMESLSLPLCSCFRVFGRWKYGARSSFHMTTSQMTLGSGKALISVLLVVREWFISIRLNNHSFGNDPKERYGQICRRDCCFPSWSPFFASCLLFRLVCPIGSACFCATATSTSKGKPKYDRHISIINYSQFALVIDWCALFLSISDNALLHSRLCPKHFGATGRSKQRAAATRKVFFCAAIPMMFNIFLSCYQKPFMFCLLLVIVFASIYKLYKSIQALARKVTSLGKALCSFFGFGARVRMSGCNKFKTPKSPILDADSCLPKCCGVKHKQISKV